MNSPRSHSNYVEVLDLLDHKCLDLPFKAAGVAISWVWGVYFGVELKVQRMWK